MLQPDFSDYLERVCKGIKSRPKREEIMEELYCHLEANYERNLAVGMTEEEAKADAIDKMGDSDTLSYRLAGVHSYSPLNAMSSAFLTLSFGYMFTNFIIVGSLKELLFPIGLIVLFSSLLRMRKTNGRIEKAFHFFNFSVIARLALYCFKLGRILPFEIIAVTSVVIYLLQGFFWFLLFSGLDNFCQPYLTEKRKKPHLYFCGVYHMLLSFFNGFIIVLSEGESVNFDAYILPFFMLFMYFFVSRQLIHMRRILWDADGEYGILPADKKHLRIYAGTILACIVSLSAFNYLSSTKAHVKTELVIHDVSTEEQKQADEIRQRMLSWDVDPQIVEDLPDSEILNYKDAEFVTWGADGGGLGGSNSVFGADSIVWYYWFFIPEEEYEGEYRVRLLCYIESHYADSVKSFYRKGFYYVPWSSGVMPLNLEDELNGSFISIVTEEKGNKYNAEPFFTYNLTDENITTYPKGFEYREEKGQRVYFAAQMGITALEEQQRLYAATVKQRWFCSFNYNTTADFAQTIIGNGIITARDGKYLPHYWRLHNMVTGFFDEEDFDNFRNNSIEYGGHFPKKQ